MFQSKIFVAMVLMLVRRPSLLPARSRPVLTLVPRRRFSPVSRAPSPRFASSKLLISFPFFFRIAEVIGLYGSVIVAHHYTRLLRHSSVSPSIPTKDEVLIFNSLRNRLIVALILNTKASSIC